MSNRSRLSSPSSQASGPGGRPNQRERFRAAPGMAVNQRLAVRTERAPEAEHAVLAARRPHALGPAHVDHPVSRNPLGGELRRLERLTRQ